MAQLNNCPFAPSIAENVGRDLPARDGVGARHRCRGAIYKPAVEPAPPRQGRDIVVGARFISPPSGLPARRRVYQPAVGFTSPPSVVDLSAPQTETLFTNTYHRPLYRIYLPSNVLDF